MRITSLYCSRTNVTTSSRLFPIATLFAAISPCSSFQHLFLNRRVISTYPIMRLQPISSSSSSQDTAKLTTTTPQQASKNPVVTTTTKDWCCTASTTTDRGIKIQKISGYEDNELDFLESTTTKDSSTTKMMADDGLLSDKQTDVLDITKSPDWMEYVEIAENRRNQEGGAGAYDTFRCDLQLNRKSDSHRDGHHDTCKWRIWGQDFHIKRLQKSFCSLLHVKNETTLNLLLEDEEGDLAERKASALQKRIEKATTESTQFRRLGNPQVRKGAILQNVRTI